MPNLIVKTHINNARTRREKLSLTPEFELGLWNAWIFLIPLFIMNIINARVFALRGAGGQPGKILYIILFLILHILPVFLPLKLNTIWFYAGLVFYIVGMTIGFLAIYAFATTPVINQSLKVFSAILETPCTLAASLSSLAYPWSAFHGSIS